MPIKSLNQLQIEFLENNYRREQNVMVARN